jgi:UDP-N-acetylglucosamine 2-epimerase (non-hydrolysing)
MINVLTVFGTRPEAIKMAPVVRALEARADLLRNRVCVTGQHREILDQALDFFSVRPSFDLDLMTKGQSPADVAARVMERFSAVLRSERPDWVLVQGDTTTTMAAALAASYWGVNVAHIEAGLRTFDKTQPFPEEINRVLVSSVTNLHFAPTLAARANLLAEGHDSENILVTGNPGVDALFHTLATLNGGPKHDPLRGLPDDSRIVLVTAHRRENLGSPLESICEALLDIANRYRGRVQIVYPVHPNSKVYDAVHRVLGDVRGVNLLDPLDYRTLIHVLRRCEFVLTDSGGIQEEAPSLGKPVLVLRKVTERPEGVYAGNARLVGTDSGRIVEEARRLLDDERAYRKMACPIDLYGDGGASPRIASALVGEAVEEWNPTLNVAN